MAIGDRTEARLLGPSALTATPSLIGAAVPASRTWVIKQITICNTSIDALVYLAIDPIGETIASNHFFMYAMPVAGFDTLVFDTGLVLNAGDQLYGYADRAGVNIVVNGWVKEV